jgi:hypothetical protein
MERQYELENLRRSIAMLQTGAPALDRGPFPLWNATFWHPVVIAKSRDFPSDVAQMSLENP